MNYERRCRLPSIISLCVCLSVFIVPYGNLLYGAESQSDWKQRWDKAINGAKKEGKVVVWGPPGELIRKALTEGFQKAFPEIPMEYSGARGGEQATRIRSERDGGVISVDVLLSGTTTANIRMKPMKALDPIEPALILPEVAEPKYWKGNGIEYSDPKTRFNLVFVNSLKVLIIYNPDQVKPEEIDELPKLLNPKWKGKFVINDPLPTGAGNVTFRWIWRVLGPEKATDYFRKIRAAAGVVDRDQRRQIEWISQGKYAFLLAPSDGTLGQLLKRGLKVGLLPELKDYGTYVSASFGSAMLVNKAPHPNAAAVFLNWVLGKDGQTAWSKAMDHPSKRTDVPTDHLSPYVVPPADGKYYSGEPKPGDRYWLSHSEENVHRSAEETKILKELFGR
ncbi:MAG: extracellular solute-binding protein [Deltaproteobacteria bacterium]|nr:extracellular solute-binding protein [Deltaproteobacteria bacterium]